MEIKIPTTLEEWNAAGSEYLPGHMGFTFVKVEPDEVIATPAIRKAVRSWNVERPVRASHAGRSHRWPCRNSIPAAGRRVPIQACLCLAAVAPREIGDDEIAAMIRKTLEMRPKGATHWSLRSMGKEIGHAPSTVPPVP